MPTTPKSRKRPRSRFSIRGWLLNNPIFPPPFGQSTSNQTPKNRKKVSNSVENSAKIENLSINSRDQSQANGVRECPLCMAECTLDQFPLLRNCPHLFCMECLHTYTKLEIQEGRVSLKCPQCTELIHPNGKNNDILFCSGQQNFHLSPKPLKSMKNQKNNLSTLLKYPFNRLKSFRRT